MIHLTPPTYDSVPEKGGSPYYNDVLGAYGNWLLDQRAQGWQVIDIHKPMDAALAERRKTDPEFMPMPRTACIPTPKGTG